MRGRCPTKDVLPYWVAQIVASLVAALAVSCLNPQASVQPLTIRIGPASLAEFLFTFALVYVVLNSATAKATSGNSFYGLAIGFTVLTGAAAVGAISGGAFNPAVAIGISAMGISPWPNLWVYLLAELAAALVAATAFRWINPEDK